jgi:hypothetical protein
LHEALELTLGLPYTARGKLRITAYADSDSYEDSVDSNEDVTETETEKVDMVNSPEYNAFIDRYSDEKGQLNYQLMNKDFIQFASGSKTVATMIGENASTEEILVFVIKSRATFLSGKKDSLSNQETLALIETLDEINPRSAFKELNLHIRRMVTRRA